MNNTDSTATLLGRLTDAPAAARGALLKEGGEMGAVVAALAEEAERLAISDLARALVSSEVLVQVADEVARPLSRARARRARAQALAYANRFEEALVVLRESAALSEEAGDGVEAARARLTMLHALARLGKYPEAVVIGESARGTFAAAGEDVLAARADINLGVTRRMSGDPGKAISHFDRAKEALARQGAGVAVLLAQLESNRAEALLDVGRFSEAEKAFRAALEQFESAKLARACGIVLGNLGDLTSRQGRPREALEHFERARQRLGEAEAPANAARLEVEQAETLAGLGMTDDAIAMYERAIPKLREHSMAWEEARGLLGLGRSQSKARRLGESEVSLREASLRFEQLGHGAGVGLVRLEQGTLAAARGESEQALGLYAAATGLLGENGPEGVGARVRRAQLLLDVGRVDEAEQESRLALLAEEALHVPSLRAAGLHVLGRALKGLGRMDEAVAVLREAIECVDRTRSGLPGDRFRAAFQGDQAAIYSDCFGAVLDRGGTTAPCEAFEIVELASARSLLDLLDLGPGLAGAFEGKDGAEESLVRELEVKRRELAAVHDRMYGDVTGRGTRERMATWSGAARELENEVRTIERRLASTASFAEAFAPPVKLLELRQALPAGVGVVQFVEEGDELSLIALDSSCCCVHRRVARTERVEKQIESLYFQVSRFIARGGASGEASIRLASACRRCLGDLYSSLFGTLGEFLASHEGLAIVPQGPLHAVPFQALFDGVEYLSDRREVMQVPSASILARLITRAEGEAAANLESLVIGVADELAPHAEEEARMCAERLGGAEVLLGAAATSAAVSVAMKGKKRVHIASHARFVASDPLSSGIRLADGWLTGRDVQKLDLRGCEIVLSGCESGRSLVRASNESFGLVRSFLAAGARELAISLWPIHDENTSSFMEVMYTHAGEKGPGGLSLGRSMLHAQRKGRQSGQHPAIWAPFVRLGAL